MQTTTNSTVLAKEALVPKHSAIAVPDPDQTSKTEKSAILTQRPCSSCGPRCFPAGSLASIQRELQKSGLRDKLQNCHPRPSGVLGQCTRADSTSSHAGAMEESGSHSLIYKRLCQFLGRKV